MRDALGEALIELGDKYKELFVVDADSASHTRVKEFAERYSERFVNVGISEQDLIGVAAGLASCGKVVIACAYAIFLLRAWEQIRNTVARARLNVKIIGTHSGISNYGDGASHQSIEDIALMRVLPNMVVVVPADAVELKCALESIIEYPAPAYMRIGRDEDHAVYEECDFKLGIANVLKDGSDVTVIAVGNMVFEALKAAQELKAKGIDVSVIDLHTIKPIDHHTIIKYARYTGAVVTAEEHSVIGGLGSAVAEIICEEYPVPMRKVGIDDVFGRSSRSLKELRDKLGLTSMSIVRAVEEVVKGR